MTTRKLFNLGVVADEMFESGGGWVVYDTMADTLEFYEYDRTPYLNDDEVIFCYWLEDGVDVWMLEEAIIPDGINEQMDCCFF